MLSFGVSWSESIFQVSVDADKFDGSDWQKSAFVVENKPAFKFLNDFVSPIWNNFREQAVPKIEKPSEMLAVIQHQIYSLQQ